MHYSAIKRKIVKRIDKLCCQPIEVFVFHAVSDSFDPALNKQVDWSSTTEFKQRILSFHSNSSTPSFRLTKHTIVCTVTSHDKKSLPFLPATTVSPPSFRYCHSSNTNRCPSRFSSTPNIWMGQAFAQAMPQLQNTLPKMNYLHSNPI